MSAIKWVVCGNYQEYDNWLKQNHHAPTEWRYVADASVLRGHENPHGIFIGTYYMRQDIKAIMLQLQVSTRGTNEAIINAWKKVELYAPQSV